jgi:hypothetical protein
MTDANTSPAATSETPAKPKVFVNFDNKLDYKEGKFGFRTIEDEKTGVKTKRPTIELKKIPVPSVEGLVAILEAGGQPLDLLLECAAEVVYDRIRDVVNADEKITSENFDYDTCSWNVIAHLDKEDRKSSISKETWDEFAKDYITIMPSVTNNTQEQCAVAAKIFLAKFNPIKNKKDIIGKLKLRLALYAEHSPKAGEFVECVEFLFKKADRLIEAKEENLVDNLGLE